MSHVPTSLDVSTDLIRCIYASMTPEKFDDPMFKVFLNHANQLLVGIKSEIPRNNLENIEKCLARAGDPKKSMEHRREDLLTASVLLR